MSAPLAVTVDGRLVPADAPALPPTERGYLVGDGLFETLKVESGKPVEAEAHLARLLASCAALAFPAPDRDALDRALKATLDGAGPAAGVLRITWSRGSGARGWAPPLAPDAHPRLVVMAFPAPAPIAALRLISVRGLDPGALHAHKTLSGMHYVVAADRARAAGGDDALLVDARGRVLETTAMNVFAVLNGQRVTPPATLPLFPGLGRARELARTGALERPFDLAALAHADEAYAVSALRGMVPIASVDGRAIGATRSAS